MDDEQHEQLMFELHEVKKLLLQQDTRTMIMMDRIERVDRGIETARHYAYAVVLALVIYVIARAFGHSDFWPFAAGVLVLYLAFLSIRWMRRNLRVSAKRPQ
jgi:hypothetical protein